MKRGQVTLFIILLIIIVFIIGLVLYLTDGSILQFAESTEMKEERVKFENYIEECHEQALETLISSTSKQLYAFDLSVEYFEGSPIFYDGAYIVPKEYKKEFEIFVEEELDFCLNQYTSDDFNLTLDIKEISVSLDLGEILESSAKIDAEMDGENFNIYINEDYFYEIEFNLIQFFDIADIYVNEYMNNQGNVPISLFNDLNLEYGVTFAINPDVDGEIISIIDESYLVDANSYTFMFMVEYYE